MRSSPIVLVVEDNAELRHVLREALQAEGYDVHSARDDTEALEILRTHAVSLLISDLTDPPAASRALEQVQDEFPYLPVVALSEESGGHPALYFPAAARESRFRALPRPFRLGELLAVSREVLGTA